jgi:hypothetical protein
LSPKVPTTPKLSREFISGENSYRMEGFGSRVHTQ